MRADNIDKPVIMLDSIVLDCRDTKSLADFYERLLG
jgi:catechol-2,3-dioxygenase